MTFYEQPIQSGTPLSDQLLAKEITTMGGLVTYLQQLPYGRTKDRGNPDLVLAEGKGTCSTKHALLKKVAIEQSLNELKLIIGLYKMNRNNTPGIGDELAQNGLAYFPEAHCYVKLGEQRIDITSPNANFENLAKDIIEEQEILPPQIGAYKVNYHQNYVKQWQKDHAPQFDFDTLWAIREKCISNLSSPS